MVRMPETRSGMVAGALGVLLVVGVVLPLAFIGAVTVALSQVFPDDGGDVRVTVPGAVNASTVYANLASAAHGDVQLGSGDQYRCRLVALRVDARHPRAYRCVVPGHGAGDLGYRVTVSSRSCWRARGDAPPVDGCIRTQTRVGGGFD